MRHLYVLAAEPRCLAASDIETRAAVPAPLRLHPAPQRGGAVATCTDVDAPCLIPGSGQVPLAGRALGSATRNAAPLRGPRKLPSVLLLPACTSLFSGSEQPPGKCACSGVTGTGGAHPGGGSGGAWGAVLATVPQRGNPGGCGCNPARAAAAGRAGGFH
jgi:hypothetical protein